jgi:hypothetical protein
MRDIRAENYLIGNRLLEQKNDGGLWRPPFFEDTTPGITYVRSVPWPC